MAAPAPLPPVRGEGGSDTGAVRGEGEDSAMVAIVMWCMLYAPCCMPLVISLLGLRLSVILFACLVRPRNERMAKDGFLQCQCTCNA